MYRYKKYKDAHFKVFVVSTIKKQICALVRIDLTKQLAKRGRKMNYICNSL